MDLSKRYHNLNRRRVDPALTTHQRINDVFEKSAQKGPAHYILTAMQQVDARSTNTLFEQANRIFNQLENPADQASLPIELQLQGSVTNNTHIRYYSDIDLLTIISDSKFTSLKAPLKPLYPYPRGQSDLYNLRNLEIEVLKEKFPAAKVDSSKPKSIKISEGSLKGTVDVVPCNWVDTLEWKNSRNQIHRGIKILNAETGERIENYPFMHNYLLSQKNLLSNGGSNKLIRFIKTLIADSKYDTIKINISSYDVCGLIYNMPTSDLLCSPDEEILLLRKFNAFYNSLLENHEYALNLMVPNKTRPLFGTDGLSFYELGILNNAVEELYQEATGNTLSNAFRFSQKDARHFDSILG